MKNKVETWMEMIGFFILFGFLMYVLAGCGAHGAKKMAISPPRPSAAKVESALSYETPDMRLSALKELRGDGAEGDRALYLQTLIVFQALEIEPVTVADREVFESEAKILSQMAAAIPPHRLPKDTGVLLHLASKVIEDVSSTLPASLAADLDRLVDPHQFRKSTSGGLNQRTITACEAALADSMAKWLTGDTDRSVEAVGRAIKWQTSLRGECNIIPDVVPSRRCAWSIFLKRLKDTTGIELAADSRKLLALR